MKMFNLKEEVAVVIGGTGVLGGAIARGFSDAGAKVAVVGRNKERGAACSQAIVDNGGEAVFFQADATDVEALKKVQEEVQSKLGNPTILLNAAGGNSPSVTVTADQPFEKIALPDWQAGFDLNLVGGAFLPCQVFGPGMVQRGCGSIINIASISAHIPLSRVVAYSAAKAAVVSLTQFLAREWGQTGVRVNSITPGFFPAEQNRKLLFNEDGSPTDRTKSIWNHTPLNRFGKPEELVGVAVFLASSQASSFVNGTDVRVDGGFLTQTI
jgi:NAD(P)-dependent dehydrogenase (short-subunit alcohol dehydrogenase family)